MSLSCLDQTSSSTKPKVDISRLDLRVGEVKLVNEHPFDKKHFLVHVKVNEEEIRRTVSNNLIKIITSGNKMKRNVVVFTLPVILK